MLHTQIAARHRQNWHPLTPIRDPGEGKIRFGASYFCQVANIENIGRVLRRNSHGVLCFPATAATERCECDAGRTALHDALSRGLAIWSQKVASCAKAISLRKFSDLKSMPRTVGSLRLRAVQLRRPLSPSREAHVFDRPPSDAAHSHES